jgi:hypothetical protein
LVKLFVLILRHIDVNSKYVIFELLLDVNSFSR